MTTAREHLDASHGPDSWIRNGNRGTSDSIRGAASSRTNLNEETTCRTPDTASTSTVACTQDRFRPYRMCSTSVRSYTPRGHSRRATRRTTDNGCAAPRHRPWHRPRLHRCPGPPRQASDHYAAGGSACSGDNLNPDVCTSVLSSTQMHSSLFQINTRTMMRQLRDEMGLAGTLDDISDEFLDHLQEKRFDWVWLLGVWRTGDAGRQISRCNETWQTEFRELIPDIQEPDICGSCFATTWK